MHAKITKPIYVGKHWKDWSELYAAVDNDKNLMFAENKQELKRLKSKGFKEISLKEAKQRLEKLVEEKELPIKIGRVIGEKLEGEIMKGLGLDIQQEEKPKEIKYCFMPPKYVFKCIDRNGREKRTTLLMIRKDQEKRRE